MTLGSEPSEVVGGGAGTHRRPAGSLWALGGAELGAFGPRDTTSCEIALPSLSRRESAGAERRCRVAPGAATGRQRLVDSACEGSERRPCFAADLEARLLAEGCPRISGGRGGKL
jgi:hypothetical protein